MFTSSFVAVAVGDRRHVTHNYCCRVREVTLSFMDTLISLTYLPGTYMHACNCPIGDGHDWAGDLCRPMGLGV